MSLVVCAALAEEPVDLDMVNKIRDEGSNHSINSSLRLVPNCWNKFVSIDCLAGIDPPPLDRKINGMQDRIPNGTDTESTTPWQLTNQNR